MTDGLLRDWSEGTDRTNQEKQGATRGYDAGGWPLFQRRGLDGLPTVSMRRLPSR